MSAKQGIITDREIQSLKLMLAAMNTFLDFLGIGKADFWALDWMLECFRPIYMSYWKNCELKD